MQGVDDMPEFKEKPKMGRPKAKPPSAMHPKQATRLMKEKYLQQLDQRRLETDSGTSYATDQVEGAGRWATEEAASHMSRSRQHRKNAPKERPRSESRSDPIKGSTAQEPQQQPKQGTTKILRQRGNSRQQTANTPKERTAFTVKECITANKKQEVLTPASARGRPIPGSAGAFRERTRTIFKTRSGPAVKPSAPAMKVKPPAAKAAKKAARQTVQRQMTQRMVAQAQRAAKTTNVMTKRAAETVARAAAALASGFVGMLGGGVLVGILLLVAAIAAIVSSPFGLFFAKGGDPDTISVAEAVAQVNTAYNTKLEELQAGDYDSVELSGGAADWPDVLAVFASRYAAAEDGVDVAALDADRVSKLTATFWDMTAITSTVETIDHPDSDPEDDTDDSRTEYILHITVTAKTAEDMKTAYGFTAYQISALDELLADRAALSSLAGSLAITNVDVLAVLNALPDDLSPDRHKVVETALQLVGKVNYFWGGKSRAMGWDSRWGTLQRVTAAGNSTSGTFRPYGLDCSGFVDWVFYNTSGGSYVAGHGGGAHAQHTYCTAITLDEAQPGDLAFFLDDSHVGIVMGRNSVGKLLICHCSSSRNGVVVTEFSSSGFAVLGRPSIYVP